jgi:hypothetical protein
MSVNAKRKSRALKKQPKPVADKPATEPLAEVDTEAQKSSIEKLAEFIGGEQHQ